MTQKECVVTKTQLALSLLRQEQVHTRHSHTEKCPTETKPSCEFITAHVANLKG